MYTAVLWQKQVVASQKRNQARLKLKTSPEAAALRSKCEPESVLEEVLLLLLLVLVLGLASEGAAVSGEADKSRLSA